MPVLPVALGVTIPHPLEPDIEHLRHLPPTPVSPHNDNIVTSTSLLPCGVGSPSDLALQQLINCSDTAFQDISDSVSWWTSLILGHDVVFYVFPVMLVAGILCDILSACVLVHLVYSSSGKPSKAARGSVSRRVTVSGSAGARCQGNVYLLWGVVSGALMLTFCGARRLSDYVDIDISDGGFIWAGVRVYVSAVDEWLSYANLWLLVAMDLEKALQLSTSDAAIIELSHSSHLNSPKPAFVEDNGIKHGISTKSKLTSSSFSSPPHSYSSSTYQKEVVVCSAIYVVCLISALPHFFSFHIIETFDVFTNRTIFLPHHNEELTDSFEFRTVYYWYVVGLTVLLPVPVLFAVSAVICRALLSRRRRLKVKRTSSNKNGGSASVVVVARSIMANKPTSATCSGSSSSYSEVDTAALTGRLLVVMTTLYVIFTSPRAALTCLEGLPSWRWSTLTLVDRVPSDVEYSVVNDMINLLAEFSFYLYYASLLPLLCSYHEEFRAALSTKICCCCAKPHRRRTKHNKLGRIYSLGQGHRQNQTQTYSQPAKKTVKFDSRTIEIELQC